MWKQWKLPIQRFNLVQKRYQQGLGEYKSLVRQERKSLGAETHSREIIQKMKESKQLVGIAISSNVIMLLAKSYGAFTSGSAAMFAESMHSIADSIVS
jgi:hypothetical protein